MGLQRCYGPYLDPLKVCRKIALRAPVGGFGSLDPQQGFRVHLGDFVNCGAEVGLLLGRILIFGSIFSPLISQITRLALGEVMLNYGQKRAPKPPAEVAFLEHVAVCMGARRFLGSYVARLRCTTTIACRVE